ncbi:MAG: SDR family oxidoreductase [Candidatus Yanofskybacteria bacterium]|nr:SDR family oxidoreductase [Candidatus Yanofskybacteria bacterium]
MKNQNNLFSLNKKTIIITGGAGLIGAAFCRVCAENGAKVVIADTNLRGGKKLVEKIKKETGNKNIVFSRCDITSEASIKSLIKFVLKKFNKIDGLINNAYPRNKNYGRKFEDVTYKDFCENVNTHLGGYFLMTKETARIMKKQKSGNIIFMGSIYGFSAPKFEIYEGTHMTMPIEYAAIKGGIINLTKYLASYFGPYGIRVNAISPGGVSDNQPESFVKKYVRYVKLAPRRMTMQEDISGVLLFLLSDAAAYITGQNIVVDGGWTL